MMLLFLAAVNFKVGQMIHFFYDGAPSYIFLIIVQVYIKTQLKKWYRHHADLEKEAKEE